MKQQNTPEKKQYFGAFSQFSVSILQHTFLGNYKNYFVLYFILIFPSCFYCCEVRFDGFLLGVCGFFKTVIGDLLDSKIVTYLPSTSTEIQHIENEKFSTRINSGSWCTCRLIWSLTVFLSFVASLYRCSFRDVVFYTVCVFVCVSLCVCVCMCMCVYVCVCVSA